MSQDANTILQGQLKQEKGLHTTRPQYTNVLYGFVVQTDISIAPLLPVGASSPIPTGMMTVSVPVLGSNYVTQPIIYPGGVAPDPGTQVAVGFTPNGTPICTTIYAEVVVEEAWPTFAGAGSPEGSVVALAVNQSYVDSETGDLWIYNGTPPGDTGWVNQAGGGGSGPSANFILAPWHMVFFAHAYSGTEIWDNIVLDPVNLVPGDPQATYPIAVPLSDVGGGSSVVEFPALGSQGYHLMDVAGVDTTNNSFTISLYIEITNLAQSQIMILAGSTTIAQSGPNQSGYIDYSALTIFFQTGTDLVFDSTFGTVKTTAGGDFGVFTGAQLGYT